MALGTATDPYELRFDTGRISLDLIATTHPAERLDSVDALRAWITGSGLVPPGTPLAHADPSWLTGFRELRGETARLVRCSGRWPGTSWNCSPTPSRGRASGSARATTAPSCTWTPPAAAAGAGAPARSAATASASPGTAAASRCPGRSARVPFVPRLGEIPHLVLNTPHFASVPNGRATDWGNPRTSEVGVRKDSVVANERGARARHRMSQSSSEPDEELMRALYREHAGPLLAYVLRLVAGDRQRAEDVVQETLIRAWKNAGQLNRATGSVRPWLVTVARRIVIDGHRSRQARPQEVDPSPLEVIPAEDEIDKALWLMTLSDALDDLTPAHREVLVETYFKGRTVNEAAQTLGIPSGTVRSRVFYALRSMKLALEERGVTA